MARAKKAPKQDWLTAPEAAVAARVSYKTIKRAIWSGKLLAYIPRGVDPAHTGTMGYRIPIANLDAWMFRKPQPPLPTEDTA